MLLPVLSPKLPKYNHIIPVLKNLHWFKIPEGIKYNSMSLTYMYSTLQSSQPSYIRQLFTIQHSSSTHSSSALTLFRFSVTSPLKFADRSIAIASPSLGIKLRQHCENYLTQPTNSPKPHPLLHVSLHASFA